MLELDSMHKLKMTVNLKGSAHLKRNHNIDTSKTRGI